MNKYIKIQENQKKSKQKSPLNRLYSRRNLDEETTLHFFTIDPQGGNYFNSETS